METKQGKVTDYDLRSYYENQKIKYLFVLEIDENYEFKTYLSQEEYTNFVSKILRGFQVSQMIEIVNKDITFEVDANDVLTKILLHNYVELENK